MNTDQELLQALAAPEIDVESVESLLQRGANPNAFNENGKSCLHVAVGKPRPALKYVELLLKHGADVNAVTTDDRLHTPLMFAAQNFLNESLDLLLASGADVSAKNYRGHTAEDFAEAVDNEPALYTLWKHKAR